MIIYPRFNSGLNLFLKESKMRGETERQDDDKEYLERKNENFTQEGNDDYPIVIHYGLNDSHSRNWAQVNKMGVVGMALFQRFQNNDFEGTLVYKSIQPDGSENTESITTGRHLEKSVLLFARQF